MIIVNAIVAERSKMSLPSNVIRLDEKGDIQKESNKEEEKEEEKDIPHIEAQTKSQEKTVVTTPKDKKIVDERIWDDVWAQFYLLDAPNVLDNTSEIIVQYGYTMLFVVVFPLMFFMAAINNFIEFRLDFYELTQSRRAVPYAASGIGVWKQVLSAFGTVAIFSNLAIITWRTDLVNWDITSSKETNKVVYFFILSFLLLLFQFVMRFFIPDVTVETQEALARQEVPFFFCNIVYLFSTFPLFLFVTCLKACEKYLLLGEIKKTARKSRATSFFSTDDQD
ncbi:hypothetical protein RFI_22261 [Reticulomyxa filosa]|uniref:Anoctamin transmembrane domain-containing protein n=1 Tax=Reticulomyxa filosa TaxID=46433 RepID=X6MNU4_RETFI|nr:hypothetical protein RFI_22261 [Reticulomyxa filosa]|eukprot:ETO15107.1 hypothetical protein RFI_22261 [Reticulomyxa filosa]